MAVNPKSEKFKAGNCPRPKFVREEGMVLRLLLLLARAPRDLLARPPMPGDANELNPDNSPFPRLKHV